MPTYVYECKACGLEFERVQPITASPLKNCPSCNGAVKRLISAGGGIIFKGSGFYATDYRSKSYRESERKDKEKQKQSKDKSKDASKDKSKDIKNKGSSPSDSSGNPSTSAPCNTDA